jgi:hypothetical protein
VDVVQAQHDRAGRGEPLEQVAQRAVNAMPVSRGPAAGDGGQHRGERSGVGQPEPGQAALAQIRHVAAERLRPERVGQVGFEFGRARLQNRVAGGPGVLGQVGEQARLPDPRLTLDRDDAAARRQRLEGGGDGLTFAFSADQRHRRSLPDAPRRG